MRVAALYDVHGNLPALEAVLDEVDAAGVDVVVFGGDVVWGGWPAQTLELAAAFGERGLFLSGNWERGVVERGVERGVVTGERGDQVEQAVLADKRVGRRGLVVLPDRLGHLLRGAVAVLFQQRAHHAGQTQDERGSGGGGGYGSGQCFACGYGRAYGQGRGSARTSA